MPAIASPTMHDPLRSFLAEASQSPGSIPLPLLATDFEIEIDSGLAIVTTKRMFRNSEEQSIEATMTFPVPVHAVLFHLEVCTDGRTLKGMAQKREQARETYEAAIDDGKLAILHEELIRGVHMLSVGHLAPGAELELETTWAMPLTFVEGQGHLHIPLTVGEIYGRSPLADSDDLVTGDAPAKGTLTLSCTNGSARFAGQKDDLAGRVEISLAAPINIVVTDFIPSDLHGRWADGGRFSLRVDLDATGDQTLNAAILVDHSGSMNGPFCADTGTLSKHEKVRRGLMLAGSALKPGDTIDVWEFDDHIKYVGNSGRDLLKQTPFYGREEIESPLSYLARLLSAPSGGTEIGTSLQHIVDRTKVQDILLITDGQSHALDVQALAASGRRFSVVLIGSDSFEANVGYLAALSGGHLFIPPTGSDVSECISTALRSLRRSHRSVASGDNAKQSYFRGGARISMSPDLDGIVQAPRSIQERAIAAVAASLQLPSLDTKTASAKCLAEGLVSHLTSLVVVDDDAAIQTSLPAQRKIPLPIIASTGSRIAALIPMPVAARASMPPITVVSRELRFESIPDIDDILSDILPLLPWETHPNELLAGDMSVLDIPTAAIISRASADQEVQRIAKALNISAVTLVLFACAYAYQTKNRAAARMARLALSEIDDAQLSNLCTTLGLGTSEELAQTAASIASPGR